jgi:hypothetical protein
MFARPAVGTQAKALILLGDIIERYLRLEADMRSATKTTDHEEIRRWVEQRGGHPARVDAAGYKKVGGILRIDFDESGGDDDERLERISWDEFFHTFDNKELAFLHQNEANGELSRFNKS